MIKEKHESLLPPAASTDLYQLSRMDQFRAVLDQTRSLCTRTPTTSIRSTQQWRNDGVAAASRDGGPHW